MKGCCCSHGSVHRTPVGAHTKSFHQADSSQVNICSVNNLFNICWGPMKFCSVCSEGMYMEEHNLS